MTHTTAYETRDGKTRRVKDAKSAPSGAPDQTAASEPKPEAGKTQAPDKPAKQGA